MTPTQSTNLIKQVAQEYLGEHWHKKLTKIQGGLWSDVLLKMEFDAAKVALRDFFIHYPSYRNDFNYRMPDVDLFKDFYVTPGTRKISNYCPCCAGTGWIYFKTIDGVVRCDCRSPEIDMGHYAFTVKTLDQIFPNYPEAKCNSFQCSLRAESPCPMGSQFYNAKKIEYMDRVKLSPAYQLGKTFHKKSGFLENLEKTIGDI